MNETEDILLLIKQTRESKKISQKMMADYLGIAQPSYNKIEIGSTRLQVITLLKITRFLDIHFTPSINKEEMFVALNAEEITTKINNLEKANQQIQEKLDKLLNLLNKE